MSEIDELKAEIDRLKTKCDKQAMILRRLNPSMSPDTFFICGASGAKDDNGLPENVLICPAYGCDFFYVYKRTGQVHGAEW